MVRNLFAKTGWLVSIGVWLCSAVTNQAASVTLAWNPSSDQRVVGYRLYQGVTSQTYTKVTDVGNATSITISNLVGGTILVSNIGIPSVIGVPTYYFAVTCYTSGGLESALSGEISYKVGEATPAQPQISFNSSRVAVLSGTAPAGYKYNVLATTNLTTWTTLTNITVDATGLFSFTDPSGPAARKFFKLQQTLP
jgi:hypothetical protein